MTESIAQKLIDAAEKWASEAFAEGKQFNDGSFTYKEEQDAAEVFKQIAQKVEKRMINAASKAEAARQLFNERESLWMELEAHYHKIFKNYLIKYTDGSSIDMLRKQLGLEQ